MFSASIVSTLSGTFIFLSNCTSSFTLAGADLDIPMSIMSAPSSIKYWAFPSTSSSVISSADTISAIILIGKSGPTPSLPIKKF